MVRLRRVTQETTQEAAQEAIAGRGNHVEISAGRILPPLPSTAPFYLRIARTIVRLTQGLYYHDAPAAAPAMAFQFFLSLIPLLVVFGYILGHFVRLKGVEAILAPLLGTAPDVTQGIVRRELERLGGSSVGPAPLAILGFMYLASNGTHGFMDALERAVHAPRRPWWKKRLLSIGWVVAVLIVLSITGWALVQWDDVVRGEAIQRGFLRGSGFQQKITLGFALGVATCVLAAFFRYGVERPKEIKRRVWPGAAMAVLGWIVMSWGFSLYVSSLGRYALFYGSLAAVAVLLVWFWLSSLVLLVGAEFNAQLEGVRD